MPPAGSSSRIDLRVEHQDLRELDELLLAVGQRVRPLVAEAPHADELQQLLGRPASAPLTAICVSWPSENVRSTATTFSSTVISRNSRVIWKVRPRPRCARSHDGSPSIRSPSSQISPESARIVSSIRLKIVVLPEPLGPIRPVIEPSGTANEAPSTALTPPKRFVRP